MYKATTLIFFSVKDETIHIAIYISIIICSYRGDVYVSIFSDGTYIYVATYTHTHIAT